MDLLNFNDDDFKQVVEADIRGKAAPEQVKALRSDEVVPRWHAVLTSIAKSVEGQLAARQAELKAEKFKYLRTNGKEAWLIKAEQAERMRARSLRFYTAVQERIVEAKGIYERIFPREAFLEEERNRYASAYASLRDAVRGHQQTVRRVDDPAEADEELWRSLRETEDRVS